LNLSWQISHLFGASMAEAKFAQENTTQIPQCTMNFRDRAHLERGWIEIIDGSFSTAA
jgi:hypothetical protein